MSSDFKNGVTVPDTEKDGGRFVRGLKKTFIWYYLLNKRLLKKAGFLVILCLIPILAFLMTVTAGKEETGFVRIAVSCKDPAESFAVQLVKEFQDDDGEVFVFTECKDPEEAKAMVNRSEADAAWVVSADAEDKLAKVIKGESVDLITVYQTEESTLLQLSREKIFAALFPHISYGEYEQYIREELLPDHELTDEELRTFYQRYEKGDDLIEPEYVGGNSQKDVKNSYLTAPLRGISVILMLLCSMASAMYFLHDEKKGTFSWLSAKKRVLVFWAGNLAAAAIAAIFVTAALALSNNYTSFGTETLMMILLIFAISGFCTLLGSIFSTEKSFGIMLPLVLVVCVVFCPIFFDITSVRALQLSLPPTYYLYGIFNISYLWKFAVYILAVNTAAYVIYCFRHRKG